MTARVVIIGAGSAGLAAAVALQRRGIDATILEQGSDVAMSWRSRHDGLRLNTTRRTSGLRELRIPREAGRWVSRDGYIAYLERFAARQRIQIRFNTTVDGVDRADGGWRIATNAGILPASDVVVATGLDRVGWIPDWIGRAGFAGPIMHVADLQHTTDLSGQHVLLAGAGNSGVDIAAHLVDAGVAKLWLSVRTPPNIVPAEIHRVPLQAVALVARPLPERLRDATARLASRYAFGDLRRFGLPTPADGPYRRLRTTGVTIAVDQGFVAGLKAGRVQPVAEIHHLDGTDAVLSDGTRLQPDTLLAATGYRTGLQTMVGHLGILDERGLPQLPRHRTSPVPGMYFIGFHAAIEGNLRQHPIEAGRIARDIGHRHDSRT
jgi:putative flavoprotein involved in K+ transport